MRKIGRGIRLGKDRSQSEEAAKLEFIQLVDKLKRRLRWCVAVIERDNSLILGMSELIAGEWLGK